MENFSTFIIIATGCVVFILIAVLGFMVASKTEQVNQMKRILIRLKRSFRDLDDQAKLIVRTDLELNKAQEELDKRLNGLEALQKTSRQISTTLDEKEIFRRLDHSLLTDIGFEKNLIFTHDRENQQFLVRVNLGFSKDETSYISTELINDQNLIHALKEGHIFSSANTPSQRRESIIRMFGVEHFVLTPILTKNGIIGLVFVGNHSNASAITEGDQEIVSILANQLGQAIENAHLFTEVFLSSQVLESKVQDRTRQLEMALAEVQRISKMKSEFISAVSHELRTPLTSIKGYASLLMTGKLGDIPDAVKQRLEKINSHSDSLVQLINNLLDIARIESGRVEMNMGRCNLHTMIDNVEDLLTPQMKDKDITCVLDVDPKIPEMILDSSQVERIFINLVGNATKFTPEKGQITIKAFLDQQEVKVSISDNGIGISPDDQEKLFNEFYKVENEINANLKGSGLGLSLAKKIVEAHGGRIWVESKINEGTTFHFTLPLPKQ